VAITRIDVAAPDTPFGVTVGQPPASLTRIDNSAPDAPYGPTVGQPPATVRIEP
jgi:hypothetical protein